MGQRKRLRYICTCWSVAGNKDEVADVHNLNLWPKLNGKQMQNGTTANLILIFLFNQLCKQVYDVASWRHYFNRHAGGCGLGFNPPIYLKPGDVMELGIDGLGTSVQTFCVAYK